MKVFSAFTVAAMLAISTTAHDDHEDYGWEILDVKMPRAISDHTASIGEDGLVYIAGGCGKFHPVDGKKTSVNRMSLPKSHHHVPFPTRFSKR